MGYSLKKRSEIFGRAKKIKGKNSDRYRMDNYENVIFFNSYGLNSGMGREIDHIKPKSKGGSDNSRNLRPLLTVKNRRKGDKYPY